MRLIVDTGLHYKGKSRDWALRLFADYAWDTSDKVEKEVTRYQSIPGQAVTYMLGQLSIMELKQEAEKALGEKFNLKDFHFQVILKFRIKCFTSLIFFKVILLHTSFRDNFLTQRMAVNQFWVAVMTSN